MPWSAPQAIAVGPASSRMRARGLLVRVARGVTCVIAFGAVALPQAPVAPSSPPRSPSPSLGDSYSVWFGRGISALDRGQNAAAGRAFLNAGELAYEAPVWRVHAGVALARAGDEGAATALFRAALTAGYPPSDLAALDPLGAATVTAWIDGSTPARQRALDEARAGWRSVSARGLVGLEGLRADVRHARYRPYFLARLDGISHVIGTPHDLGNSRSIGRSTFEYFEVDPRASTATPIPGDDARVLRGADAAIKGGQPRLVYPDAPSPWPRGAPFVRAVRSGLLIDVPEVRVEHDVFRLASVHTSDGRRVVIAETGFQADPFRRIEESIDLGRLTLRPVTEERTAAPGSKHLEEITDPKLRERAAALLGREARLWRLADGAAIGPGALLAACDRQRRTELGASTGPLLLLDEAAQTIVHEYDFSAARAAEGPAQGDLYCGTPAIDLEARRLVVSLNVGDGTLEAFDTSDGAFVWRVPARRRGGGTREVSFAGPHIVVTSQGDFSETELLRADDGTRIADGASLGLTRLRGSEDGSLLVGEGLNALFVFDTQALQDLADALTREPRLTLWLLRSSPAPGWATDVVAVASDGTWHAPAHAVPRARVRIDDTFVPAEALAPWLYDPLHVRTALDDADPIPRRFPWPQ